MYQTLSGHNSCILDHKLETLKIFKNVSRRELKSICATILSSLTRVNIFALPAMSDTALRKTFFQAKLICHFLQMS